MTAPTPLNDLEQVKDKNLSNMSLSTALSSSTAPPAYPAPTHPPSDHKPKPTPAPTTISKPRDPERGGFGLLETEEEWAAYKAKCAQEYARIRAKFRVLFTTPYGFIFCFHALQIVYICIWAFLQIHRGPGSDNPTTDENLLAWLKTVPWTMPFIFAFALMFTFSSIPAAGKSSVIENTGWGEVFMYGVVWLSGVGVPTLMAFSKPDAE